MALESGTRVGIYGVTAKIGEGAMGEVYRALDTTLDRDVALKVLPEAFTADPERLARFQREAKVLASLNHPNIGGIYGIETSGETQALVLELIEGPTLAERIADGPIPVEQAVPMVRQIAEALSAAHDAGIIHRDLKPANIKVRSDGTVKVLDFGLAKAAEGRGGEAADAPTMTAMSSQAGAVVGTAAYMAPEQARGETVDKRADIWALGCVCYELLSGHRPFEGRTMSDTLASVLAREVDLTRLPEEVPAALHKFMARCLEKEPMRRLRDAAEGVLQLEEGLAQPVVEPDAVAAGRAAPLRPWQRPKMALGGGVLSILLTAGASFLFLQSPPVPAPGVARASLTPPPSEPLEAIFNINIALTPDGTRMVYRGLFDGQSHLFVRALDEFDATPLTGLSPDPRNPFISPDGTRVGFFDGRRSLQRVSILGGPPVTITDIQGQPRGASWGPDDMIVFATSSAESGLLGVPVGGGDVNTLTVPDPEQGERDHHWPQVLPGGEFVLFTIRTTGPLENAQVAVLSLETGEYDVLFPGGSSARYVPTGHIVYGVGGTLRAVGFDLDTLTVTTEPIPVIEEVLMGSGGEANFDVAQDGSLVYVSGTSGGIAGLDLVWVDQEGNKELLPAEPGNYTAPRLSPDGSRMAIQVRDIDGNSDIFTYDISRNNFSQFTFDDAGDCCPLWSPDGARIMWTSARNGTPNLYMKNADGTGEVERVGESGDIQLGFTWSADGTDLIFASGNGDLYALSADDQVAAPLFETVFAETRPRVSPDGRWIAYESNEDGNANVYVRPFPDVDGGKWKVSAQGGAHPLWSPDGRELFFSTADSVLAAPITTDVTFNAGNPRLVFQGRYEMSRPVFPLFDLAPDGTRFLMMQRTGTLADDTFAPLNLVAVFNWFEELKERVPVP